jgi:hypothetical protein
LPIVERRLFGPDSTPVATEMTALSPDGKGDLIESYFWDAPNLAHQWYSFWDLETALPLMDRRDFAYGAENSAVQSARIDSKGRYLVFVTTGDKDNEKLRPVTSLEIRPPAGTDSWIADFAEAIGGISLDDQGVLTSVPDRLVKLRKGLEKVAKLSTESNTGK